MMPRSAPTRTGRYVLCRPHGGLNDTLGVINDAWSLAEDTGRILVVDGRASTFARDLSIWFEPRERDARAILHPNPRIRRLLDAGTCHPEALTGRLDTSRIVEQEHETISWLEWRMPVDAETGTWLRLDLDQARFLDHDVLLHECYGGGMGSITALERLQLTARAARRVHSRLTPVVGRSYVGIHIRNSDLQSDYRHFLTSVSGDLAGRYVLVCSDDGAVLRDAIDLLPRSRVITTSAPPTADGRPYQVSADMRRRRRDDIAIDALVDVFALAGATDVLAAPVVNRTGSSTGFGVLAAELRRRPDLRAAVLRQAAPPRNGFGP